MDHLSSLAFDADLDPANKTMAVSAFTMRLILEMVQDDTCNPDAIYPKPAFSIGHTTITKRNSAKIKSMAEGLVKSNLAVFLGHSEFHAMYAWTPMGRALAKALRMMGKGTRKSYKIFDLLDNMPDSILHWLCNLPNRGTVPEFSKPLAELELIRIRPRTGQADLHWLSFDCLGVFFESRPNRAPEKAFLKVEPSARAEDRALQETLHQRINVAREKYANHIAGDDDADFSDAFEELDWDIL